MAMIDDYNLTPDGYTYQVWDEGWARVCSPLHPNAQSYSKEVRSANRGDPKPDPLFSYWDLYWAIDRADDLDELREALNKVKERTQELQDSEEVKSAE